MRVLAGKKGFSLVELLTVIAIIALLAGIIFPVLGMVQKRAQLTKCITQLHQIGLAVQVFKQDNRKYPDILGAVVVRNGGKVVPFDQPVTNPSTVVGLYPEYVKAARMYHCPGSKSLDTSAVIPPMPALYDPVGDGNGIEAYAYNSYDFMIYGSVTATSPDLRQRYAKSWANSPADVARYTVPNDSPELQTRDYERQLKFRTPPDSTVVTWCSWHEVTSGTGASLQVSGKTPTLFIDGHVDNQNASDVETSEYRVAPRRE